MASQDKLITVEDWIESFWNFQEEDFKYFQQIISNFNSFDPEEVLKNIKERMKARKIFYQIYKYLPSYEFNLNNLDYFQKKLNQIIYREEMITDMISKILDLLFVIMGVNDQVLGLNKVRIGSFTVH